MPASVAPKVSEKCWTCRRRRLKCDATEPACRKCADSGLECPGYVKPLRWVGGVASRGLLKDSSFPVSNGDAPRRRSPPRGTCKEDDLVVREYIPRKTFSSTSASSSSPSSRYSTGTPGSGLGSPRMQLVQPIFQDMGYIERYLLDYFNHQVCSIFVFSDEAKTPYRELIPLISSSYSLSNAMMAVSALHIVHRSTDSPIMLSKMQSHCGQLDVVKAEQRGLNIHQAQLLELCLSFKQTALQTLSLALRDPTSFGETQTMGTALLFALLETFETGAGSWAAHIEGARRMLGMVIPDGVCLRLIEELTLFEIFGSTLSLSKLGTSSVAMHTLSNLAAGGDCLLNNSFMCPVEILETICIATITSQSIRQASSDSSAQYLAIVELKELLVKTHQFDADSWMRNIQLGKETIAFLKNVPDQTIAHMCVIWKLAAGIYISLLLYVLTGQSEYFCLPIEEVITESVAVQDRALIKFMVWPAFVTGIACTLPVHRQWAMSTLEEIWDLTFCANAKGAIMVLKQLWEKKDAREECLDKNSSGVWDWLHDLSTLDDDNWILF